MGLKMKNRNLCLRLGCDRNICVAKWLFSAFGVRTFGAKGGKVLSAVGQRFNCMV